MGEKLRDTQGPIALPPDGVPDLAWVLLQAPALLVWSSDHHHVQDPESPATRSCSRVVLNVRTWDTCAALLWG